MSCPFCGKEHGTSCLERSNFEKKQIKSAYMPIVDYVIIYDDQDRAIEHFTVKKIAYKRLDQVRDNWNCHLFKRIESV